ncbi:hypothetical protein ACFQJ7_01735 [Halovenus rubra]|uniref:Uncharacterized protein n=2 Tax=Halovenus rubra TaxID=869890 RepID=A0ACC7E3D5_9EURY|nr:hypothetical protein [Halovenus rubra]
MKKPSRRQYLVSLSGVGSLLLAGCVNDEEPEFLVTNTAFSLQPTGTIDVQVTIENGFLDRHSGTIEVIVRYESADVETKEWRKTSQIELSGGTEILQNLLFKEIHQDGFDLDNYDISAQLLDTSVGEND